MSAQEGTDLLQFDTAVPSAERVEAPASSGVTCDACHRVIDHQYFDLNGHPVCGACRQQIALHSGTPRGARVFGVAAVYGSIAAFLGAVLYYAVIAITNFEIGLVAIAIGYMVGYAVRVATEGRGGRRFQILAVALTYWSVGLAYTPMVFRQASNQQQQQTQTTRQAAPQSSLNDAGTGTASLGFAFAVVVGFSLALPILAVLSSMPGGLITAAIIGFGMHQAWRMTAVPEFTISGPYRITAPVASTWT